MPIDEATADDPMDKLLDLMEPESLLEPLREERFRPSGLSSCRVVVVVVVDDRAAGFGLRPRSDPRRDWTTPCSCLEKKDWYYFNLTNRVKNL